MKKIIITALPVALLLTLAACTSDNDQPVIPPVTPPDAPTLIAARLQADSEQEDAKAKPGTRSSVKPDNDNITAGELFRWDKADELALAIAPKATPATVALWQQFTINPAFDPETSATPQRADFNGSVPAAKAGDVLYGLSPHRTDYGSNLAAVPLKIATVQTQTNAPITGATSTAHLGQNMLMYAKATLTADITDANPGSTALLPALTFRHFSPLVRFRVRNASNTPWRVTKIEMRHSTETNNAKWFATAATCNLTAADNAAILSSIALSTEPANRSRSITLNVVNGKELPTATTAFAPGNHLNAYIALLPTVAYTTEEAAAGDYINICITLSSTNPAAATKELIYKVPYKDVEFLRNGLKSGLRYSFSFSIKTEEVELDGLDIAPWNNATGDGNLDWE